MRQQKQCTTGKSGRVRAALAGAAWLGLAAGCAAPAGEPIDVLQQARLRASATAAAAGLPWPREAEAAIACVRDGHPDTGWSPPLAEPAAVEIDLQPAFGRPLPLERLQARWAPAPPPAIAVELAAGCGLQPERRLSWNAPETALALDGVRAGCLRLELEADAAIRLVGLELTGRTDVPPQPAPAPAATRRSGWGAVEGFYGVPWSPAERRRMLQQLAALGLGSYVYAPKHDPLHRAEWRRPYPDQTVARFAALAELAAQLDVELLFGISPFADFDAQDPAEHAALQAKLEPLVAAGADGVVLLADDIEESLAVPIDGALGAQHAAAANRLRAALAERAPGLRFWFVPTVYTDERLARWPGGADYLRALAELHPAFELVWVGPEVFNAELQAADLDTAIALSGRRPVLWDNFWANDGGDGFMGRLLLAPYTGHAADLPPAVAGCVQNPLIQGGLARLNLAMFGRWLSGGAAADPDAARRFAAELELGHARPARPGERSGDEAALVLLLESFAANGMQAPGHREMEAAVARLHGALDGPAAAMQPEVALLLELWVRLAGLRSALHHGRLAPDLVDELDFPLRRLSAEAEQGLWTLAALAARLDGDSGTAALDAAAAARERAAAVRFAFSPQVIAGLHDAVAALPPRAAGLANPAPGTEPPGCSSGRDWCWQPFSGAARLVAGGLPGARIDADRICWTPEHPGRYRLALAGLAPAEPGGWAVRLVELSCGR